MRSRFVDTPEVLENFWAVLGFCLFHEQLRIANNMIYRRPKILLDLIGIERMASEGLITQIGV